MHLVENLHHLRPEFLGRSRELLSRLSSGESSPPALLITCADVALLAESLMPDHPERFFCTSALGTFVPTVSTLNSYGCDSTAAAIEYAVRVLRVGDIIVCGHTGCRAMALLCGAPAGMRSPHLSAWRARIKPIVDVLRSHYAHVTGESERQRVAEMECVLFSLENLQTYPSVRESLESGAIRLHGWCHDSASEELSAYEPASGQFEPLMGLRSLAGRPAGDFRMEPR